MKCLSLWQPWASLLVHGRKQVETRGWPIRHRGPLLVHAAKTWNRELRAICTQEPFKSVLESLSLGAAIDCGLPLGLIVGRVEVVNCFSTDTVVLGSHLGEDRMHAGRLVITPTEVAFGDYSSDRFAFLCKNPVAFATPITYRGAQGLFDVPENLLPKDA